MRAGLARRVARANRPCGTACSGCDHSCRRSAAVPHPLMVTDHLVDDEPQELLREIWVESRRLGERAQARDLLRLAPGIGRRQARTGLIATDRLRNLKPLCQQE